MSPQSARVSALCSLVTRSWPWLCLAPALIVLLVFGFWPVLYGVALSFTDFTLLRPAHWVGLENYRALFDNALFLTGLTNSLLFLLVVPLTQLAALALAMGVNRPWPGMHLLRTAYYVPVVTSVAVVGIMWNFILHEEGSLNAALRALHLIDAPIGWLNQPHLALAAVMFVSFWRGLGWYMVMYLAALQSVPEEVQDAARLDGAHAWQRFWHITVPMLRPTIALCSTLSLLAALKAYQEVDVLTQGGPMNATFTALYYAYDQGLKHLNFPRGLASSAIMSAICILVAVLFALLHIAHHRSATVSPDAEQT